jgi:hypothetical protein
VRHLDFDFAIDGEANLTWRRASEATAMLTVSILTSAGRYHVLCRVDGFTLEQQETGLKLLAITFGGDRACTHCDQVLRLPGFFNCKYDPAYCHRQVSQRFDFESRSLPARYSRGQYHALPCSIPSRKRSERHTNPDHEFAGLGKERAYRERRGERRANAGVASHRYAQFSFITQTGQSMLLSATICRLEVIPTDDAVTILEVGHPFEIPAALCSARAHAIVLTVQGLSHGKRVRLHHIYRATMPLLEIRHSLHISGSIRLDKATTEQRISFLPSSEHPQLMLWARSSRMSSRSSWDFPDSVETPHAEEVASTLVVRNGASKNTAEQPAWRFSSNVQL